MNMHTSAQPTGTRIAQPADEEIKHHGDELQQQVDDAAGKKPSNHTPDNGGEASDDAA